MFFNYKNFAHQTIKGPFKPCIYTSYKKCRDNYVGDINKNASSLFVLKEFRYENRKKLTRYKKHSKNQRIVLLMESPHKQEFMENLVAPALGKTGENIHRYLPTLLYNMKLIDKHTEIFLVNVVQYQCSLGFETKKYRNKMFKAFWGKKETKRSLKRRLKRISPDLIINAMTSIGKIKSELTNILKKWGHCVWVADTHPACWNNKTTIKPTS